MELVNFATMECMLSNAWVNSDASMSVGGVGPRHAAAIMARRADNSNASTHPRDGTGSAGSGQAMDGNGGTVAAAAADDGDVTVVAAAFCRAAASSLNLSIPVPTVPSAGLK